MEVRNDGIMERLTEKGKIGAGLIGLEPIMGILTDKEQDRLIAALNKLADYEDAEENGTLIKLPCKVGDTVYDIDYGDNIDVGTVTEIEIKKQDSLVWSGCNCWDFDDFGKTVFLTREAVEAALKERND